MINVPVRDFNPDSDMYLIKKLFGYLCVSAENIIKSNIF